MHAMVLESPADISTAPLRSRELPTPRPADNEILVEVAACGVCRTDLQLAEGDLEARRLPIVPGHQIVGRVAQTGSGVSGWKAGDRIGVTWLAGTCGHCRHCRSGRENLCADARFTGWDRDGGFARYVTVAADVAVGIPSGFDDLDAAPLLCGGVIGYRALRIAGASADTPGRRLGLFGFGASARLAIQVAVHWGCEVYVCTRSERERADARALGATWVGGRDESPPVPLESAITFAPVGEVVIHALRSVDRGGVVVVNAIHLDRIPEFPYEHLWWERSLRSVANVTRADAAEFMELAASIPVRTSIEVHPLARANLALQRIAAGEVAGAAVLRVDTREAAGDGAGHDDRRPPG